MHNQSMIYGYARVSSNGQDLAQQLAQLDAAGCTKIYREKVSAATAERPQLKRAIGALDAGDVLMVTATDRLARPTRDLLNILHAEIGRASCRARLCQYVEISVVAVSFKTKLHTSRNQQVHTKTKKQ